MSFVIFDNFETGDFKIRDFLVINSRTLQCRNVGVSVACIFVDPAIGESKVEHNLS